MHKAQILRNNGLNRPDSGWVCEQNGFQNFRYPGFLLGSSLPPDIIPSLLLNIQECSEGLGGIIMTDHRRFFWLLTLTAFLITANGCSSSRWQPINEELDREGSGLYKESGQKITGYLLSDGTMADYPGLVRLVAQDSLVFWQRIIVSENGENNDTTLTDYDTSPSPEVLSTVAGPIFSLDKVKALKVKGVSGGKTGLGVLAVFVGLVVLFFATFSLDPA